MKARSKVPGDLSFFTGRGDCKFTNCDCENFSDPPSEMLKKKK